MSSLRRLVINLYHTRQCLLQHRFHSVFRAIRLHPGSFAALYRLFCSRPGLPAARCHLFCFHSSLSAALRHLFRALRYLLRCPALFPGSILCLFCTASQSQQKPYTPKHQHCLHPASMHSTHFFFNPFPSVIAFHNAPVKEQKAQHKVFSYKEKTAASPRLFFPKESF